MTTEPGSFLMKPKVACGSMSLIHELVYQNESFDSVDFGAFFTAV